jgi:hypothetical protein
MRRGQRPARPMLADSQDTYESLRVVAEDCCAYHLHDHYNMAAYIERWMY